MTNGVASTELSVCFFYETATGRVIPSYIDEESHSEYDELYDRWLEEKNGG